MRIGIDARELCGRATGTGRYLHGLLAHWSTDEKARKHEFVLYAPESPGVTLDARRFPTRIIPGHAGTWWEQIRVPPVTVRDHLDAFFAPAYTAPLRIRVPTVVTIHDISFAAHPEWFTAREGLRRRWLTRRSALRASAIITVSEFSKRELIERFAVPESHIQVIHSGVTRPLLPIDNRPRGRHVLYVGSIFSRRHVPDLIRAFALLARTHRDVSLDIVGSDRSHPRENVAGIIEREGVAGAVRWREYVSDEDLGALYGTARAFAFLSEYEGFGFPPLEALAAGVPSVLLDTPVAREICGEAALYVRSGDIAAATSALEQLLFDEAVRRRLLAAAPAALARYSWPRAAAETLALLERSV